MKSNYYWGKLIYYWNTFNYNFPLLFPILITKCNKALTDVSNELTLSGVAGIALQHKRYAVWYMYLIWMIYWQVSRELNECIDRLNGVQHTRLSIFPTPVHSLQIKIIAPRQLFSSISFLNYMGERHEVVHQKNFHTETLCSFAVYVHLWLSPQSPKSISKLDLSLIQYPPKII